MGGENPCLSVVLQNGEEGSLGRPEVGLAGSGWELRGWNRGCFRGIDSIFFWVGHLYVNLAIAGFACLAAVRKDTSDCRVHPIMIYCMDIYFYIIEKTQTEIIRRW